MTYDTSTWKPFCFGRLMMLLPPEAVTTIRCTLAAREIKLRTDLTSMDLLNQEIKARQNEFKSQTHKNFENRYIGTYDLGGRGYSVFGYLFGEINDLNDPPSHARLTHNYFFTQNPFQVWYIKADGEYTPSIRDAVVKRYTQLATQIRPLADGEVPKEFGCVIEKGIIRSDTWEAEGVSCSFELPWFTNPVDNLPLVIFSMESRAQGKVDSQSMLDRLSPMQAIANAAKGVRTIRKEKSTLNGIEGEQYILRERSPEDDWSGYLFRFASVGKPQDNYHPTLSLTMKGRAPQSYKKPAPPFANDEAAVAFWDAVVGTLRLRPVLAADGRTITDSGAVELPPTCQSEGLVPRTGVYEAQIDASHPSASYFNEGPLRWAYKQEGERMGRLGAYGAEHLVTWTWIRKNWEV